MFDDAARKIDPPIPREKEEWREIAERASNETDPVKLLQLIEELCSKLEEREARRKAPQPGRGERRLTAS
jgi:hypothetical protein